MIPLIMKSSPTSRHFSLLGPNILLSPFSVFAFLDMSETVIVILDSDNDILCLRRICNLSKVFVYVIFVGITSKFHYCQVWNR
jgi:hypothetical protein